MCTSPAPSPPPSTPSPPHKNLSSSSLPSMDRMPSGSGDRRNNMNEGISRRPSPSGRQNSIKNNQQQQQQQRRPSYSPQRPGDASPRPSPRRKSRRRPSPSSSGLPPIVKDNRRQQHRWWAWAATTLSLSSLLILMCGAAFWLGRPAGSRGDGGATFAKHAVPRSLRAAPTTTPMPTTTLGALSSLGTTNDQTAANHKEAEEKTESNNDEELHFGDVIHVVYTRFMQQQPNLLSLGRARLLMFQTFCLPSVMEQTNPDFLWIIRTDPDLAPELRTDLVNLLKDQPNFLLVGSNDNPEDGFRHDSAVQDVLSPTAKVWSGDVEMASKVHRAAQSRIVLETRLDADDGLHVDFARAVQADAVQALSSRKSSSDRNALDAAKGKGADATSSSSPEGGALRLGNGSYGGGARQRKSGAAEKGEESDDDPKWMVWCVDSHVEWHYESPFDHDDAADANNNEAHHQHPEGYLVGMHAPHCVTPGLTFGYGVGASRSSVSVLPPGASHQDYHKKLAPCDEGKDAKGASPVSISSKASSRCLRRLSVLAPGAIRPRTPTSAGLLDVVIDGDALGGPTKVTKMRKALRKTKWEGAQDVLWKGTEKLLAVRRTNAKKAVTFLKDHLVDIARDNLMGQCTKGHSCKKQSEEFLRRLVKRKEEEGGGETPSEGHKDKRPERIRIRP